MKVFIGCATEQKNIAASIAQVLSEHGFTPVRWWETIRPGAYPLDELQRVSQEVDAAVLLMTADDFVVSSGDASSAPKPNLLLEYGMFVTMLGRKRALIVAEGGVRLPSNVDGLSVVRLKMHDITAAG